MRVCVTFKFSCMQIYIFQYYKIIIMLFAQVNIWLVFANFNITNVVM